MASSSRSYGLMQLLMLLPVVTVQADLKQVHVITRHGARFPLTKNATTLQEGTPGSLTARGMQQMYDLGVWLQNRYGSHGGDGVGFIRQSYDPSHVRLESSSFDRTIVSANALALGLFASNSSHRDAGVLPNGMNVAPPVYTSKLVNDVTIRAYDNCDRFLRSLTELYKSPAWIKLESAHDGLLSRLGQIPSFDEYKDDDDIDSSGKIPLTQVWNVYDSILVAKTECSSETASANVTSACDYLADSTVKDTLSDADWNELQALAHETETMKYGSAIAGVLVGRNLLLQILQHMEGFQYSSVDDATASFYLYSAHYPTLLGVFAALEPNNPGLGEAIPGYASAIVFEFHVDSETRARSLKMFYRSGESVKGSGSYQLIGFDKTCLLGEFCPFDKLAKPLETWSEQEWCTICDNQSADVCLAAASLKQSPKSCSKSGHPMAALVSGFALGILGMAFFNWWCRRKTLLSKSLNKNNNAAASARETATPEQPGAQIL